MKQRFIDKRFTEQTLRVIDTANEIIDQYMRQDLRLTLRQLFYQFVSHHDLPNTEQSYKNLAKTISQGRLAGKIDWSAIEDRGRQPDTPLEFRNLDHRVRSALASYRLDRWRNQEYYAELWVEKQALAGVLWPLALKFHATLMVNKGYCVAPSTRILTADLRWIRADDVRVGDELIGADEDVPAKKHHRRARVSK